jgi:hypothetical protein
VNRQRGVGKGGKFNLCFRQEHLTSHAGTVVLQEFAQRLGVEQVVDEELQVKVRERGDRGGQAIQGLVDKLILGGSPVSDLDVLRGDPGTQEVRAAETLLAPTTAGEFLRNFAIGDVQDLPRVHWRVQQRVRAHPQSTTCTIALGSSIYDQGSTSEEGSTKAYHGGVGYPPLVALWAEQGELLFSHVRRGSAYTARTIWWVLRQTFTRVPAPAVKHRRADSGFYSKGVVEWCEAPAFIFTSTAEQPAPFLAAIVALPEQSWRPLPADELADVAELDSQPTGGTQPYRYVVNRELAGRKTGELSWPYQATVPNDEVRPARTLVGWHLQHAARENAMKEQKSGLGVEKLPTQKVQAHWAYFLIGQLAFKLLSWFTRLGLPPASHQATSKPLRPHRLNWAGKIVHTARHCFLMLSDRYRYHALWRFAIGQLAHPQFG